MRDVAIVSPLRTAVGNFGGSLKDLSAAELGSTVIKAILDRTGLECQQPGQSARTILERYL